MIKLWDYIFNYKLGIKPHECTGIILTEPIDSPKHVREETVRIMFENFEIPNCYLARSAVMSVYAKGRTTGMVIDSGEGLTQIVPVFEGFNIPHAVKTTKFAGNRLTK